MFKIFSRCRLVNLKTLSPSALQPIRNEVTSTCGKLINKNEISFELPGTELWLLEQGPATHTTLTKDDAIKYLKSMITVRRLEEVILKLYLEKHIRGFCHVYTGQEAVVTGICIGAMKPEDVTTQTYRVHGWGVCLGISVEQILAELMQLEPGVCKGRGGSMHLYNKRLYGGQAIVGATGPLGAGLALGQKRKGKGVAIAGYGDGASNQGQVYEAMNLAALLKLPVIFLIENNRYGMGTSVSRSSAATDLFRRVNFVPGICIDGQNILSVREAARFCIDYALKNGPIVLEAITYRYKGHSVSDSGKTYRTADEVSKIRKERDPIDFLRDIMDKFGFMSLKDSKALSKSIDQEVQKVAKDLTTLKQPDKSTLAFYEYAKPLTKFVRGTVPGDLFKTGPGK